MQNQVYFQELEYAHRQKRVNTNTHLLRITEKISNEIQQGRTQIQKQDAQRDSRIKQLSNKIQLKKNDLKKQLNLLSLSLKRNSHSVRMQNKRRSQKAISLRSYRSGSEISQQDFEQYENKKREAATRLKQLKKLRDIASQRRKQIQRKRQQKLELENRKKQKEQRDSKQKQKQQKLNSIKQKIKQFQQNKQLRLSRLKESIVKSSSHLPRYKQMKTDFDNQQQRMSSQRKNKYKKDIHLKFQQFQFDNIKKHEKEYVERLKQRFGAARRTKTQDNSNERKQLGFRLIGKDRDSVIEGRKKIQKMKEFEQVTSKIKLNVNIHKNIEIQIAKDKAQNPMKYNFLRQKHLNDYQIYKDFKNFNMQVDAKQLGNSYLNQIKKKNKSSIASFREQNEKVLKTQASSSERKQYKNYLEESRKNARVKQADQIQNLFRQYGDKSKVMQILQQRSQYQKVQALQKIVKMRKMKTYGESVQMEKEVDSDFIESIKTKIKCIGIK